MVDAPLKITAFSFLAEGFYYLNIDGSQLGANHSA